MTRFGRLILMTGALATLAGLGACRSSREAALQGQIPDDFRVVARAPLIIPPEYALRPPRPGEPRPQELNPESSARAALGGVQLSGTVSDGERMLITRAGGNTTDPLIRQIVDDEGGDLSHKPKSFADLVMFWRPGDAVTPAPAVGANEPAPIDPAEEAARITALTGNYGVVIQRASTTREQAPASQRRRLFKLPGL